MKLTIIINLIILMIFSGCGYKKGLLVVKKKAFLYFPYNVSDVQVSIDNGELFDIKLSQNNEYPIELGKHNIKVYKNNELIIHKNILAKDGDIIEIEVK